MIRGERTGIGIWDGLEIEQKECFLWRFPTRELYVERIDVEWHILALGGSGTECSASRSLIERAGKPASSAWRHVLNREGSRVQPTPALPDRPVVVRPDRSLILLPGESSLFFLEIPVWFRLSLAGERQTRIFEEPIVVLSNTWFGDPVNGELCYALGTRLHQGIESVDPCPYRALCPLFITNESETDLVFDKICLHAENLNVFKGPSRLWTNRLNVIFKGSEQTTQIQILTTPPDLEGGVSLAAEARQPADVWNIRKTFGMLKYFTDF
jgi:hypothetical protein